MSTDEHVDVLVETVSNLVACEDSTTIKRNKIINKLAGDENAAVKFAEFISWFKLIGK